MAGERGIKGSAFRTVGVLRILGPLYRRCSFFLEFLSDLEPRISGGCRIREENDSSAYENLLRSLIVCVPNGARNLPASITTEQVFSQTELVFHVLQRLCSRNCRNVVSFGYKPVTASRAVAIDPAWSISKAHYNTTTALLAESSLWNVLFARIGDQLALYLLEECALYRCVPPACAYQICGAPLYDLAHTAAPTLLKRKGFQHLQPHAKHFLRCSPDMVKRRKNGDGCTAKAQGTAGRKAVKRHEMKADPSTVKKPRLIGQLEQKGTSVTANTAQDLTGQTKLNLRSFEHHRGGGGCGGGGGGGGDGGSCTTISSEKGHRKVQQSNRKVPGAYLKDSHSAKPECFSWARLLYSKNLRETFWENHPLNKLGCANKDANALLRMVFGLDVTQRGNKNLVQKRSRKHPRLPRRFVQMKGMFVQILQNHKRCPYRVLLSRYCPIRLRNPLNKRQYNGASTEGLENDSRGQNNERNVHCDSNLCASPTSNVVESPSTKDGPLHSTDAEPPRRTDWRHCVHQLIVGPKGKSTKYPIRHVVKPFLGSSCSQQDVPSKSVNSNLPSTPGEKTGPDAHCSTQLPSAAYPALSLPLEHSHPVSACIRVSRRFPTRTICRRQWLLSQHSDSASVYGFLRAILLRVLPMEAWGSPHNRRRFLRILKTCLGLGRLESLGIKELCHGMRVNDCSWLQLGHRRVSPIEHCKREETLQKFFTWVMQDFVMVLLSSFFYITETMFQKNKIFFYRKNVWCHLHSIAMRQYLSKGMLKPIAVEERKVLRRARDPEVSRLRFVPKRKGFRPILKSPVTGKLLNKEARNLKNEIQSLFDILNYKVAQTPELLGSSVLGLDAVFCRWRDFATHWRNSGSQKPLYFVKVDVEGAYDSIPQRKVFEVVSNMLKSGKHNAYLRRHYATIWATSQGALHRSFTNNVSSLKDFLPMIKEFVSDLQIRTSLRNAIVVEQGLHEKSSSDLFTCFQKMYNTVISIGQKSYLRCCGVPQGSQLSALLCSACYAEMEHKFFPDIDRDGFIIRLIDDFLLVTPHVHLATYFLRTLLSGVPEYGCRCSIQKTVVNFSPDQDVGCATSGGVRVFPLHCLFPWCGLLFDTRTLEVYSDYSGYVGVSMRSTLTIHSCSGPPGNSMRNKLFKVLKLKCHKLFLDLQLNSVRTVLFNVYKILLLQAFRFHACVCQLPGHQHISKNPRFFLDVVTDSANCCWDMVQMRNRGQFHEVDTHGLLRAEIFDWLCSHAFTTKLSKHHPMYTPILRALSQAQRQAEQLLAPGLRLLLDSITQPALHKDFSLLLD
uniref:telomerase reverse transcriptase n=1 Tax=Myxine glutinosa TaxID=7769 RepID=UPI00358E34BD